MTNVLEPFRLSGGEQQWSLLLPGTSFSETEAVFQAAGHEGGGYDWEAVAREVSFNNASFSGVNFDSEGGMFCAFSADRLELYKLGEKLKELFEHPEKLRPVIDAVRAEFWD